MSTYDDPEHVPELALPLITSQYVPAGIDVVNVAVQLESALLMATKPAEPVGVVGPFSAPVVILQRASTYLFRRRSAGSEARPSSLYQLILLCFGNRPCQRMLSIDAGIASHLRRPSPSKFRFLLTLGDELLHMEEIKSPPFGAPASALVNPE